MILNELADYGGKVSAYKKTLPEYFISKIKIEKINNPDKIINAVQVRYKNDKDVIRIWTNDGLKIDFKDYWVHMRKSNTEPIIRIITEAKSKEEAERLQKRFLKEMMSAS